MGVLINILETVCMFLVVSLVTWKITDKDLLQSKYFKFIYGVAFVVFVLVSNSAQILTEVLLGDIAPFIAVISTILIMGLLLSALLNNFRKVHLFLFAMVLSMVVVVSADFIVLGTSLVFIESSIIFGDMYIFLSLVSILVKYLLLISLILVYEPTFFSRILNKNKDYIEDKIVGVTASAVTMISSRMSRYPCWFFFYQAKTPKSLLKKNVE